MNVNPFSYLIEKLKGKVDTHDGWLNGIDANTLMSDGFYRLGVSNSNLPNISTQKDWSTMYVNSNGTDASQIFVSNTSRVFERVKTSGSWGSWNEVALKSDIWILNGHTLPYAGQATFDADTRSARSYVLAVQITDGNGNWYNFAQGNTGAYGQFSGGSPICYITDNTFFDKDCRAIMLLVS